jgi:hypothetical protein
MNGPAPCENLFLNFSNAGVNGGRIRGKKRQQHEGCMKHVVTPEANSQSRRFYAEK